MGKWMDTVKSLDAQVTLPAKPTEALLQALQVPIREELFDSGEHIEERSLSWSARSVRKAFDGELQERRGEETPSTLLTGLAAAFHADILNALDDGELVVICERLDVAYKAGNLDDRCLDYLTSAVTDRANQLEAADDVEP
jgi:hypothetical protein